MQHRVAEEQGCSQSGKGTQIKGCENLMDKFLRWMMPRFGGLALTTLLIVGGGIIVFVVMITIVPTRHIGRLFGYDTDRGMLIKDAPEYNMEKI